MGNSILNSSCCEATEQDVQDIDYKGQHQKLFGNKYYLYPESIEVGNKANKANKQYSLYGENSAAVSTKLF